MPANTDVTTLGTILGVWAHPDDEAFLSAGLMAIARRHGHRVVVVTATAGEHGTADPGRWPPSRLGALRRRELAASLAALGVSEHHLLDWPDGGLSLVPRAAGAAQVRSFLERIEPDTVITFGPEGMTGHPDHRAISAWTTEAWDASGRRARLLYATVTPEHHEEWGEVDEQVGLWSETGERPETAAGDLALHVECSAEVLDQKLVALRAHASQMAGLVAMLGDEVVRRWWQVESFADARRVVGTADDEAYRLAG